MNEVTKLGMVCLICAQMGCAGMTKKLTGSTDSDLKDKVSYDTKCPVSEIEIINRLEKRGFADYEIKACGETVEYKRTGSVFHKADEDPLAGAKKI